MFGWRRRSEGFEWREHVRTTILVRRADRQRRIDDARLAALARAQEARARSVEAGKRQLDEAKGRAIDTLHRAGKAGHRAGKAGGVAAMHGALFAWRGGKAIWNGASKAAMRLPVQAPAVPQAVKNAGATFAMYASDVPRRWRLVKPKFLPAAGFVGAVLVFGAVLSPEFDEAANSSAPPGSITTAAIPARATEKDPILKGRATAVSGDTLRIDKRIVRLAGIDAPESGQQCVKSRGRKYDCGASARKALRRLIRRHQVQCELNGQKNLGADVAHCRAGDADIAKTLVRGGNAFATEAYGAPYANDELIARTEKAGFWGGEAERPEDWRTRIWEEAKKNAPDGCPIKGMVRRSQRTYVMPWSRGYSDRRLTEAAGERWFCSEDEARAAGFDSASGL